MGGAYQENRLTGTIPRCRLVRGAESIPAGGGCRAAKLADEHTISVYDAAYVADSDQADGTLVSCDIRDLVSKGLASGPAGVREDESPPPAGSSTEVPS
jgi:hypothetical protein